MNSIKVLRFSAFAAFGLIIVACASVATNDVRPTVVTTPEPIAPIEATTDIKPDVKDTPSTDSFSPSPTVSAEPTAIPTPVAEEIDCMGACHEIDITMAFGAGAKLQPSSHKGRTTCLTCHATLTKPALPTTHLGRLDAACSGCHKVK